MHYEKQCRYKYHGIDDKAYSCKYQTIGVIIPILSDNTMQYFLNVNWLNIRHHYN